MLDRRCVDGALLHEDRDDTRERHVAATRASQRVAFPERDRGAAVVVVVARSSLILAGAESVVLRLTARVEVGLLVEVVDLCGVSVRALAVRRPSWFSRLISPMYSPATRTPSRRAAGVSRAWTISTSPAATT